MTELHGPAYYWSAGAFASACIENGLRALERFKGRCCWCGLLEAEHINPARDFRPRGYPFVDTSAWYRAFAKTAQTPPKR